MADSDTTGTSPGDLAPEPRRYEPFRFSDSRQKRIYERLLSIGPGPAAFFFDACRLLATDPPLATTSHLIAHLYREIESALRDVVETVTPGRAKGARGSSAGENHESEIKTILAALEIPETDPVAVAWLRLPGKNNDYGLHARAHRNSLDPPRPAGDRFRRFCAEFEGILDVVTKKHEERYLSHVTVLDRLLAKVVPDGADIKTLKLHVPCNYVTYSYFFDRLSHSGWLDSLRKAGFFLHPPESQQREDPTHGTLISHPPWPQARYLTRMAPLARDEVREIMMSVPDTDNDRVHEELTEAACALPPTLAADWARRETTYVVSRPYLHVNLPEALSKLVEHLARGGRADEALGLARALLAVFPDPQAEAKAAHSLLPVPRVRFDVWEYGEIIRRHVPDLVSAAGEAALGMLCDLLQSAVELSRSPKEKPPTDGSMFWRPAVEEHEQNRLPDLKGMLVVSVRDSAESLIELKGKAVLDLVETRPYRIFQRIGLHLRRKWPQADREGTAAIVANPEMLRDTHLRHELHLLLQERFGSLARQAQEAYLSFVEEGPDIEAWRNYVEQQTKHRPDKGEAERYVRHWRLVKLLPVQTFLEGEWKKRFEDLTKEFELPERSEFPVYTESTFGSTSPKSVDDLRSMSVEEMVSFLKEWKPEDPFGASREGLAGELAALAVSEPERIGAEVERFQDPLLQKYIRRLMWGFKDAVKQKGAFPWRPVLALCSWVMSRPRDERASEGQYEEDPEPGWAWTRQAIASLLSSGFEKQRGEHPVVMPFEYRDKAWEILLPLTDDPDPQPEEEGGMDPATHSINSTRGEAMHAVVRYALWVKQHMEQAGVKKEQPAQWLDEMPEVRQVLDGRLDPDQEPSPVIRAVYGQWLPQLTVMDTPWMERNLEKVFPREKDLRHLRDTAWDTYVIFNRAYDSVFDLLRNEYRFAVEQIGETAPQKLRIAEPQQQLVEHLMALYWRGKLDLDDPESLLRLFYGKAPETLRRHAIEFVGRSLRNTYEVPAAILDRLRKLWEWRVEEARKTSQRAELVSFGWWFVSGKCDDPWALRQLAKALELAGKIELDSAVAERLAELAESMPMQTVECLKLMVEGDKDKVAIYCWREHARSILRKALESTDGGVQEATEALVHLLGARGHLAFRDLLQGGRPTPPEGEKTHDSPNHS